MDVVVAEFLTSAASRDGWPPPGPPEIAFAGRSNVGKSSTINALCGRRRLARVSGTPGRTRLVSFFTVTPRGGPELRFVDLPGYGYAKVSKAQRATFQGLVEPYVRDRVALRLVVSLCDARRAPGAEERDLLEWLGAAGRPALVVMTKIDKVPRPQRATVAERLRRSLGVDATPVGFSARTGEGRDQVWRRLLAAVRSPVAGEAS